MTERCPICDTPLNSLPTGIGTTSDVQEYSCPRCGLFRLTSELKHELSHLLGATNDNRAKISHALRRSQDANPFGYLDRATFEKMLKVPLPRPREQADLLIRWIAKNTKRPGEEIPLNSLDTESVIGANGVAGFRMILEHLKEEKLILFRTIPSNPSHPIETTAQLTFDGWEHFEQIQAGSAVYRKAFMAMEYGHDDLDLIVRDTFKPSTKRAEFELIRQDQTRRAGLIDNRMRVEIQGADFLIADLTHRNPGAYWEAGYAEGLGKPVIFTCEKSVFDEKKTHFDTNHHLTIVWDEKAPEVAGEELTATIRATLPHLAKMSD